SAERALALVHRLIADGQNLQHFCREAIRHFRNLLVVRVCGAESDLVAAPEEERSRLASQAAKFGEEDLTRFFKILLDTDDDLRRKPDPRLHLELGLLKLVNAQRLAPLEELLADLGGSPRTVKPGTGAHPPASSANSSARVSSAGTSPSFAASSSGAAVRMAAAPQITAPASAPSVFSAPVKANAPDLRQPPEAPCGAESRSSETSATARPAAARSPENSAGDSGDAQVAAIKTALQAHKFLWSMVESATRWEIEGGELRLFFPEECRVLAEMLEARDAMERLRTVLKQVVGKPLRVCVKLELARAAESRGSELQTKFEKDPIVRAMLERFGGQISKVKHAGEE
ncbi:MAG: hypothetical protein ACRD4M_06315, partial [Candidatus Acidiferrales bacterium]